MPKFKLQYLIVATQLELTETSNDDYVLKMKVCYNLFFGSYIGKIIIA